MNQPFYLLSNASSDTYPNNTLTEFTNVLPKTLSFNETDRWEVGIEAIGVSSMFRNVLTPKSGVPVIFAGHELTKESQCRQSPTTDERLDFHFSLNFDIQKGSTMMYLDLTDKYYTQADVYSMCRLYNVKMRPYCKFIYDGQKIVISFSDFYNTKYAGTWIFLHEAFAKSFKFQSYEIKKMTVL
jgi:hypothetical protein